MAAIDSGLFGWDGLGARSDLECFDLLRDFSAYCNGSAPRALTTFHTPGKWSCTSRDSSLRKRFASGLSVALPR